MALQSSGAITFANIQTVFGGTNPISLSEYYQNASTGFTSGVSGIPNIGSSISLNQFYGKAKPVVAVDYMVAGNASATMSGGSRFIGGLTDDSFFGIGTVGFPFFWFGTDWGSSSNIQWCTNNVMTFGGGSSQYTPWSPGTGRGVLMGQADRMTNWADQSDPYSSNNHSIKRFIVNQTDYGNQGVTIQYAIRLIRGPVYQYIEIRFGAWNSGNGGIWAISDGGTHYGFTNVGQYASIVLRSNLSGTGWEFFPNRHISL